MKLQWTTVQIMLPCNKLISTTYYYSSYYSYLKGHRLSAIYIYLKHQSLA